MKNSNTICVILPEGYKLAIRKHAKEQGLKISDVVRLAVKGLLGL